MISKNTKRRYVCSKNGIKLFAKRGSVNSLQSASSQMIVKVVEDLAWYLDEQSLPLGLHSTYIHTMTPISDPYTHKLAKSTPTQDSSRIKYGDRRPTAYRIRKYNDSSSVSN